MSSPHKNKMLNNKHNYYRDNDINDNDDDNSDDDNNNNDHDNDDDIRMTMRSAKDGTSN